MKLVIRKLLSASNNIDKPNISSIDPLLSEDAFGLKDLITISDLFNSRAHLGHKSILRNEYMTEYLYGERQGFDIIDLNKTLPHLFIAANFAGHIAYRGGIILFMTQNKMLLPLVEETAKKCGEYSYCREWSRGTLTDNVNFYGERVRLPDLIIFLSTLSQFSSSHFAVRDAAKLLIPTIGIVDSNSDPRLVTYPVPGNDDSITAAKLWCDFFGTAIIRGKKRAKRDKSTQRVLQDTHSRKNSQPGVLPTNP